MKLNFYLLPFLVLLLCCSPQSEQSSQSTQPSNNPNTEEWLNLFNGKNLDGWDIKIAGKEINENYLNTVVVEDSMIRIKYDQYEDFDNDYGHIYYQTPYSYYKIKFDYRFIGEQTKGGASWNVRNSGIMFHSQSAESNEFGQWFPISVELQLLGGLGDGERTTANVCTPGTAVEMNDEVIYEHCINSTSKTYHGDQWVHVEAWVMGGEFMTFIVEGDTVLTFQNPQIGDGMTSYKNEGKDFDQFQVIRDKDIWISRDGEILEEGYIALQAESHPIDFKNIKLLNLCGCMDEKAKNYKSYYVKNKPETCIY